MTDLRENDQNEDEMRDSRDKRCVEVARKRMGQGVVQARHREGYYLAETNTYHENIPNSKTACVRTERQQVGTK